MRTCLNCKKMLTRSEAKAGKGLCEDCNKDKQARIKVRHDLITTFSGKGKRGFLQWLKKGGFLTGIIETEDLYAHNDRIDVIEVMIAGNFDKLLDKVCDDILKVALEAPDA